MINNIYKQRLEITKLKEEISNLKKILTEDLQMNQPQEDFTKIYDIPVGSSAVKGPQDAPITIVGFLDLECPYSARFQPIIDQLLKTYPDKVRFVAKHFPLPFHPNARLAAKVVLAAGKQGKYFQMQEAILKNNRSLSEEKFLKLAKELKLNIRRFKKDLSTYDTEWDNLIESDFQLGTSVAVMGTPTYYINGRKTRARDINSLKQEIEQLLK
ncbi:MAG: thioredoxin domain-containing protein [Candidatus Omnitrophica bacterium]|nr:thioredoxin domain-containing protein [Candidatus Omnitrophota bacterium]